MKRTRLALPFVVCSALAANALAGATVEFLPPGILATDLSADGSVLVGNVIFDGSYETFRWTHDTGWTRLGRGTVNSIGVGGGSPDISYDGTKISASILSSDNQQTMGIWDLATGEWTEAIPPLPADGRLLDSTYASTWGLSGDGNYATGFYYNLNGRARPCRWSPVNGVEGLVSTPTRSCRVNAASYNGSVVVGWEDMGGPWQPRAWRDGVMHILSNAGAGGMAEGVNADGAIIVGSSWAGTETFGNRVATIWHWNGASYDRTPIGMLPDSVPGQSRSWFLGVSDSGNIAVGYNMYEFSPGGAMDGIVWTPEHGLQSDVEFIDSLGLTASFPDLVNDFDIRGIEAVSADGNTIIGSAVDWTIGDYVTFVIRLEQTPACPGDIDGDNLVGLSDVAQIIQCWGQPASCNAGADLDASGSIGLGDIAGVIQNWAHSCR
ncbi:MAG TPA: hypothetical protein VG797_01140 [Phycisphaerales bacterium]|nr:hypothetical protein [Phycisphaerales bacterium]